MWIELIYVKSKKGNEILTKNSKIKIAIMILSDTKYVDKIYNYMIKIHK